MVETQSVQVRPVFSKAELFDRVSPQVDVIVDDDRDLSYGLSTILDLNESDTPLLIRQGLGWQAAADLGVLAMEETPV